MTGQHCTSCEAMRRSILLASLVAMVVGCESGRTPTVPKSQALLSARTIELAAPANVVATATSSSEVHVTWIDNSSGEYGFEVHRSSGDSGLFELFSEIGADVTTATFSGFSPSSTYCYRVRAFTIKGKTRRMYSPFSNAACVTTFPPPPIRPSATIVFPINSTTVEVRWSDNSGDEEGFHVERSEVLQCTSGWELAGTVGAGETRFAEAGRVPEQPVCYRVKAFVGLNASPYSPVMATVPPAPPTDLVVTAVDHLATNLTWMDRSRAEDGYEVQRALSPSGPYQELARLHPGSTSFRDGAVTGSTTYWYRVRATKGVGGSDFSSAAAVTVPATPPPAPPLPPVAAIEYAEGSEIGIRWTDRSWNEDGFRIELSLDDGISWALTGSASQNVDFAWVNAPVREREIRYRVLAFNAMGDSPPSNEVSVTIPLAPTSVGMAGAVLTWVDRSNIEDGYAVASCTYMGGCWPAVFLPANTTTHTISVTGFDYYSVVAFKGTTTSEWVVVYPSGQATTQPGGRITEPVARQ